MTVYLNYRFLEAEVEGMRRVQGAETEGPQPSLSEMQWNLQSDLMYRKPPLCPRRWGANEQSSCWSCTLYLLIMSPYSSPWWQDKHPLINTKQTSLPQPMQLGHISANNAAIPFFYEPGWCVHANEADKTWNGAIHWSLHCHTKSLVLQ